MNGVLKLSEGVVGILRMLECLNIVRYRWRKLNQSRPDTGRRSIACVDAYGEPEGGNEVLRSRSRDSTREVRFFDSVEIFASP